MALYHPSQVTELLGTMRLADHLEYTSGDLAGLTAGHMGTPMHLSTKTAVPPSSIYRLQVTTSAYLMASFPRASRAITDATA